MESGKGREPSFRFPLSTLEDGPRSPAVIFAFLVSDQLVRVVRIEDLLPGHGTTYQVELEAVVAEASKGAGGRRWCG